MHDVAPAVDDEFIGQAVHSKLLPDPNEMNPDKQVHDEVAALYDEPDGQAVHAFVMLSQ